MSRAAWGFMQSGDFPVPVGHWKFGKNTGTVLYDSSPNGNDGTIHGASWVKGWLGPALSLDGIDNYISYGNGSSLDLTDDFTIIFRTKPGAVVNPDIICTRGFWKVDGWYVQVGTSQELELHCNQAGANQKQLSTADALVNGEWAEYAVVKEDATAKWYKNALDITGVHVEMTDPRTSARNFRIGNDLVQPYHYPGILDEFIIFDEVLTVAQLRQIEQGYR